MEASTSLTINIPPTAKIRAEKEERHRGHGDRSVSYKDKFHKMREKYDKVTAAHEIHQRDLEVANAKVKKLQAENEMLLDAIFQADTALYEKYFPSDTSTPPLVGPPMPSTSVPQATPRPVPGPSEHHAIPTLTSSYQPTPQSTYNPYPPEEAPLAQSHPYDHSAASTSPRRSKRHSHSSSQNYGGPNNNGTANGGRRLPYEFARDESPPANGMDMDDGHRSGL